MKVRDEKIKGNKHSLKIKGQKLIVCIVAVQSVIRKSNPENLSSCKMQYKYICTCTLWKYRYKELVLILWKFLFSIYIYFVKCGYYMVLQMLRKWVLKSHFLNDIFIISLEKCYLGRQPEHIPIGEALHQSITQTVSIAPSKRLPL